jgi:hypothetical protein
MSVTCFIVNINKHHNTHELIHSVQIIKDFFNDLMKKKFRFSFSLQIISSRAMIYIVKKEDQVFSVDEIQTNAIDVDKYMKKHND